MGIRVGIGLILGGFAYLLSKTLLIEVEILEIITANITVSIRGTGQGLLGRSLR